MSKSFLLLLQEAQETTNKEYEEVFSKLYPNDSFKQFIKQQDKMGEDYTGKKAKIETSGNLYYKTIETDDSYFIFGLISKSGRMNRKDIEDFKKGRQELIDKLESGKTIYTSVNDFSRPLLTKILDKYKVKSLGKMEFPEGTWETLIISKD